MLTSTIKSLILISLLTISCRKSTEKPAPVPYSYDLFLKFTDQAGTNLLSGMTEDDIKHNIKITSQNGKIIASGIYIKEYNGQKLLNISVGSQRSEFLDTIDFSITNTALTGSQSVKLLKSTWQQANNGASVKAVHYESEMISPTKDTQSVALVYYHIIKP